MGRRRKAREVVLQALYEAEFSEKQWQEILEQQTTRRSSSELTVTYAHELLSKVKEDLGHLDGLIKDAASNWEFGRISLIDKNILRFALAEILFFPQIPSKVIINEAIEIAHKYSSAEAGRFVNGVLDRFAREYRDQT